MVPQTGQENFARMCWITFHWRGMSSSISVTSMPILRRACRSTGTPRVPDIYGHMRLIVLEPVGAAGVASAADR
jgi:hypothetical protein